MPAEDSLKRLGAGRWETRDGRFAIEPQSGTWAVVDHAETDELGLPLVRGPFKSLTVAKEAIDQARQAGPTESPLKGQPAKAGAGTDRKPRSHEAKPKREAARPEPPAPPPEPKWLRDLTPADRRRARDLIERLEKLGIGEAAEIARAEIARDEPALARLGIERSLRSVIAAAKDPDDAVRAALGALSNGRDRELDVHWRLVDDRGRPLGDPDLRR